jgi:hypothetical protein
VTFDLVLKKTQHDTLSSMGKSGLQQPIETKRTKDTTTNIALQNTEYLFLRGELGEGGSFPCVL